MSQKQKADCLFCKIIKKELPSTVVYENEAVYAFKDIYPQAPAHILVIPKVHYTDLTEIPSDQADVFSKIFSAIQHITEKEGLVEKGFRIACNTKEHGAQTVFHLHFHILGGEQLGSSMVG